MNNKKNLILASAAALVAVIAVSGFAFSSFAADTDTSTGTVSKERQFGRGMMGNNLTDEQKEALETKRTEFETDREVRRTEMETAIDGGFETWSNYIKEEMGDDAKILETITAENFARFKEGHDHMEEGRKIMEELGLKGEGMGMGMGMGKMMGHKRMGGGNMPCALDDTTLVQ